MGTPFPTIWEKTLEKVPGLKELVQDLEGHIIHGEVFGPVQVLKYGAQKNDLFFRIFDIQEIASRRYLDWMDVTLLHPRLPAFWVPLLHKGPWSPDLVSWAEGRSSIAGANHIREGVVIKPMKERWDQEVGRVVLKVISEAYRLKDYDQGGH
jgi:RNA ligase (TIGR02306 family)